MTTPPEQQAAPPAPTPTTSTRSSRSAPRGAARLLLDVLDAVPPSGSVLDDVVRHRVAGAALALDLLERR